MVRTTGSALRVAGLHDPTTSAVIPARTESESGEAWPLSLPTKAEGKRSTMIASAANGIAVAVVLLVVLAVGVLYGQRWQASRNNADRPIEALPRWQKDKGD
jgi:hypothetical protein